MREFSLGSSPHAWGIREARPPFVGIDRFIPTCVGNTRNGPHPALLRSVHPHMRGEYAAIFAFFLGRLGSSPHAWGIQK